jgi:hypothetical protein
VTAFVVFIGLLVWGLGIAFLVEDRLLAWYVRRCRDSGAVALAFCLGVALAVAVGAVVVWAAMAVVREATGSQAAQAAVYVPAALLVAPFVGVLFPSGGQWPLPGDLRRAGAPPAVVRASLVLFPVTFAALALLIGGAFATFGDG